MSKPSSSGEPSLAAIPVLVVEDDLASLKLTSLLLTRAGARVTTATNAETAAAAVDLARPRVAVVDLVLPRMGGFTLIETLRQRPEHRSIVFVAVSVLNGPQVARMALAAGCSLYLRKPLDNDTFATTVARLLGEPP